MVQNFLKEIEEAKEEGDSTDSIAVTIKGLLKNSSFFHNKIENLDIPEAGKIPLSFTSKLIAVILNKKYNKVENLKSCCKSC